MKVVPMIGSPPMPTQRRLAHARVGQRLDDLVGQRPERETSPTGPRAWMLPGMIPTFASPGEIMPGQFGPISRAPLRLHARGRPRPCRGPGCPR